MVLLLSIFHLTECFSKHVTVYQAINTPEYICFKKPFLISCKFRVQNLLMIAFSSYFLFFMTCAQHTIINPILIIFEHRLTLFLLIKMLPTTFFSLKRYTRLGVLPQKNYSYLIQILYLKVSCEKFFELFVFITYSLPTNHHQTYLYYF